MNNTPNLLFLGDVMPGENVYHLGRGIRTKYGHDYSNFIPQEIKEKLLDGIDAVVYNFEYSLAPDDFDFKDFESSIYASTVDSLCIFPDSIIRIVNIANNHFWERGLERTRFTIETLKKHGFVVVGETNQPTRIEIKSKKLLFWGVSLHDWDVPVFTATYDDLLQKLNLPDKKDADEKWIMSIHWGTEFMTYPDREQVVLAHKLIDNGFDIVHGHHPHVFQPIERYNNGFIMYSMGNFIFDENFSSETQKSYCIKTKVGLGYPSDYCMIKNINYRPNSIFKVDEQHVTFKDGAYWSRRKKRLTSIIYNIRRKFEYLLHIADNDFYIYKSMKKRKKLS